MKNKNFLAGILIIISLFFFESRLFADKAKIKKKLASINVDHMGFEDAHVAEIVNLLRKYSKEKDPDKEGVNFLLLLDKNAPEKEYKDDGDDDFLEEGGEEEEKVTEQIITPAEKKITIMFDDLSLEEAIKNICIAGNLNYKIDDHAVIICSPSIAIEPLETRIYPRCQDAYRTSNDENFNSVKDYFLRRGVHFPNGTEIVYDNSISRIIATNTPYNLRKIEYILDDLDAVDPQVLITTRYVKIAQKDFDELKKKTKKHGQSGSLWTAVLESDKTEVIASMSVLTQNGEEATIRTVKEEYFPESWGEGGVGTPANNTDDDEEIEKTHQPNGEVITQQEFPEFGETTELGVRMTVTPTVDPDKYTLSLDAIPEYKQHIGWTNCKSRKIIRMPVIKAVTVQTQITSYDGYDFLVASNLEDVIDKDSKTREKNLFMQFCSARLVKDTGVPFRSKAQDPKFPKQKNYWWQGPASNKSLAQADQKIADIVIDKINFKDAELKTAVSHLVELCKKQNNDVKFKLSLADERYKNIPKVNLQMEKVSLASVLKYLRLITGLEYKFSNQMVILGEGLDDFQTALIPCRSALITRIVPYGRRSTRGRSRLRKKASKLKKDPNITKFNNYIRQQGINLPKGSKLKYDPKTGKFVLDSTKTVFEDFNPPERIDKEYVLKESLKQFFKVRGVSFPVGAAIDYDKKALTLVVHNTPANIYKIDYLIRSLDLEQPQAIVESTIVEIAEKDLIALVGKKQAASCLLPPDVIEKITNSDKARIIASQQVLSKSGEEATGRLVNEEYFADSWTEPEVAVMEGYISATASYPEFGEATDLGARFIVTPTVSPDNNRITLALNPQYLKFGGWSSFDWAFSQEKGKFIKRYKDRIMNPIIYRKDLTTRIRVLDGSSICVARTKQRMFPDLKGRSFSSRTSWTEMLKIAKADGQELNNVFFFIKAYLVNQDGLQVQTRSTTKQTQDSK